MIEIDKLVKESLLEFMSDLLVSDWQGVRENEARSLYVFGYLVKRCRPRGFLHDLTQIAIEVPVPQIDSQIQRQLSGKQTTKADVTKDLVVWPKAWMTCWQEGKSHNYPSLIMEWKINKPKVSSYDVRWLQAFSLGRRDFVGYALCIDRKRRNFALNCTRVYDGQAEPEWLLIN